MHGHDVCCMQGKFAAAAGCYMSGHRSEVRRPPAAPDGPFPFLEKIVSRNTSNPRHIDSGEYAESQLCQEKNQESQSESEKGLAALN